MKIEFANRLLWDGILTATDAMIEPPYSAFALFEMKHPVSIFFKKIDHVGSEVTFDIKAVSQDEQIKYTLETISVADTMMIFVPYEQNKLEIMPHSIDNVICSVEELYWGT